MRRFIKEYFRFSRSEVRMLLLISVLILLSLIIPYCFPSGGNLKFTPGMDDQARIDSFIQSLEKIKYEKEYKTNLTKSEKTPAKYKVFDPNSVTLPELQEMGFPTQAAKNLIRYREAGGEFKTKTDIKKIYGFTDSLYNSYENFIVIALPDSFENSHAISEIEFVTELNKADSVALLKLKGIGPFYAGKIILYRTQLGGFERTEQLLEIWGMDIERLSKIEKQVSVDSSLIEKICLNEASESELVKHPYITRRMAASIIKYREFVHGINNDEELIKNNVISIEELKKLESYISF